ncbi:hypothetical protein STCU_09910 [Strigomonas culicis]|uniref:Uncharacterized protein n=1 Tax=Strigomonas culicis TaxID=28005 RepID=S9V699_9TRYP|nr:hypothetical protein STCU_09910 [Strigomonas culicis]|eukprot:EPY18440.1 hypothetical protein STCU_09910 [Strigomonas culicis]
MASSFPTFSLPSTHFDVSEVDGAVAVTSVSASWGFPIDAPLWTGSASSLFRPEDYEALHQRRLRGRAPRTACHLSSPVVSTTPTNGLSHIGNSCSCTLEIQSDSREWQETVVQDDIEITLLTDFRSPWE